MYIGLYCIVVTCTLVKLSHLCLLATLCAAGSVGTWSSDNGPSVVCGEHSCASRDGSQVVLSSAYHFSHCVILWTALSCIYC